MIKHTLIYLVAFAAPGALGFLSFSAYTRFLSPSEYAIYSVGASVAFLIGNVCFGWVRFSIGRFQAESPESNFVPFALTCLAVTAVIVGPPIGYGVFRFNSVPPIVVGGILSMTVGQALFDITQEVRRARRQSVAFTRISVVRSLIGVILSVGVAYAFHSGAAVLFSIATGFALMGVAFIVENRASLYWGDVWKAQAQRFFYYGMPLALSGLVFSGNSTLARIIVVNALGAAAAGQYGAALDLTGQLTMMIASSVCSIMGPAAIRAYGTNGAPAARKELATGLELFLGILAPMVVGLAISAPAFAAVVSGHAFEGAVGQLIPLLVFSRALNVFSQFYLHLGFQIVEKPLRQVVCGGATLALNFALSYALTKPFGLTGAAVALLVADLGGVLVSFVLLVPVFPMPFPLSKVARVAVATACMAVACQGVVSVVSASPNVTLAATVATGVAVYAGLVWAFDIASVRALVYKGGHLSFLTHLRRA